MSLPAIIEEESIKKIVILAQNMIHKKNNLVLGSREIYKLLGNINEGDREVFDTFRLVEDDTAYIPIDKNIRQRWNKDYLKKLDKELIAYEKDMKESIIKACQLVIRKYSDRNN